MPTNVQVGGAAAPPAPPVGPPPVSDKLKLLLSVSEGAICNPSLHDRDLQVAISDPQVAKYPLASLYIYIYSCIV